MRRPTPQQVADLAWAIVVIGLVDADFGREEADIHAERSHLTGTTFSSTWRRGLIALCRVLRIPLRYAKYVNLCGLVGLGWWLYRHIGDHLDNRPAEF